MAKIASLPSSEPAVARAGPRIRDEPARARVVQASARHGEATIMHVTVRRHQADEARSVHDFVIHGESAKALDRHLRSVLRTAQAERARGVWSDEDPEVWIDGAIVGRLGRDGDIAQLTRQALVDLSARVGRRAAG
jgi:hypothetical protein